MKIILIRHGETEHNQRGIVQGQIDGALNDRGFRQAAAVAARLKNIAPGAIYASDLKRADETAAVIASAWDPPITVRADNRLREQSFGSLEGQPLVQFLRAMKDTGADFTSFQPPGGESFRDLKTRAASFIDEIKTLHNGDDVVVVTHYGFINAVLELLLYNQDGNALDRRIGNGSITIIDFSLDDRAQVVAVNHTDHL